MQQGEHEIISDDGLMQLYFTQVDASNELLPAHWHEHLEMICMQHGAMTAYINETSYELHVCHSQFQQYHLYRLYSFFFLLNLK